MRRATAMSATVLCLLLTVGVVSACGSESDDEADTTTIPVDSGPTSDTGLTVAELIDGGARTATVRGYVVWAPPTARLCEVLAESFPPQCGGASVTISDPEAIDPVLLPDHEGLGEGNEDVKWSDDHVELTGEFDGESLTLGSGS